MYLFSTHYIVFSSDRCKIQILMLLSDIYDPEGLKKKKSKSATMGFEKYEY